MTNEMANAPELSLDAFAASLTGETPEPDAPTTEQTPEPKKAKGKPSKLKLTAKTLDALAQTHKELGAAAKATKKPPAKPEVAAKPAPAAKAPEAPKTAPEAAPKLDKIRTRAKELGILLHDDAQEPKTSKMLKLEIAEVEALQLANATKTATPEPKVKKLVPKGTNAKRKLIREAAKDFPETFGIVDWEGHKLSVMIDASSADLDTGEVRLAVGTGDSVLAMHSPNVLKAIMTGAKAKTKKATGTKTPRAKKPHVKGEAQTESNIPLMMRLLTEGKTQEEIFTEFRSRYMTQEVEHKDENWTWDRCVIYCKIAYEKLTKEQRAKCKTTEINKPGKGQRKAKPAKEGKAPKAKKLKDEKPSDQGKSGAFGEVSKVVNPKPEKKDGVAKAARKAKQAERDATLQATIDKEIKKGEDALKAALALPGQDAAKVAKVVAATRELKEIKVANTKCLACNGTGKSSKGQSCNPCGGKGLGKAEA